MNQMARKGVAILMISSELPEVVGMSDRVYVMRKAASRANCTGATSPRKTL
jgi:ribose transport system ATP-binding protein